MKYPHWIENDFSWMIWRFAWYKGWERKTVAISYRQSDLRFTRLFLGLCFRTKYKG